MVDRLYDLAKKLDEEIAKDTFNKNYYTEIIDATKKSRSSNENKLAAQLIPKYFKYFPDQSEAAFEALVDLCEDTEDKNTVITALKSLSEVGKSSREYSLNVIYVYQQIIQSTIHQSEIDTIHNGLDSLLYIHPDIVSTIFKAFIPSSDKDDKKFSFLKRLLLDRDRRNVKDKNEYELSLSENIFNHLSELDPSSMYFKSFIEYLSNLSIFKSPKYSHILLDSIIDFKSKKDDKYTSFNLFINVIENIKKVPKFYSDGSSSTSKFVDFINRVVSFRIKEVEEEPIRAKIFQIIAEVSPRVRDTDINSFLDNVYKFLDDNLPSPSDSAKIYFSSLEPLLYSFHYLGFKSLGYLPSLCGLSFDGTPLSDDEKEKREWLKKRLSFIFINSNKFLKSLNEKKSSLKQNEKDELKKVEKSIVVVSNVKTMVDLLNGKKPKLIPSSDIKITPSWVSSKLKNIQSSSSPVKKDQVKNKTQVSSPQNKQKKRKSIDNSDKHFQQQRQFKKSKNNKGTGSRSSNFSSSTKQSSNGKKKNFNDIKITKKFDSNRRR